MGQSWTNKARKLGMLCAVNLSLYLNCFAGVDQGEKKVTLNVVEENCVKVFKQIEKQTKMSFFYSTSDIKLPGKVSISVVNAALDEVMGRILEGTGLEWVYTENIITIRKKKGLTGGGNGTGSVVDSNINMITVTGKVVQADGTAIPGATVRVKRTGDGVTTDGEGGFSLPRTRKNDLLTISFIGYETREIPVNGNSILVKLNLAVSTLDETVVKGYYSTTQRLNTGSVNKISAIDISRQTVSNPIVALQGRIPGLYISQSSGISGSLVSVSLRGRNSIRFDANDPLYIVDGVPYFSSSLTNPVSGGGAAFISPFSTINPADIESIEVLKDADATAIYGSRGANGVILITTKKGKAGKTTIDININSGIGTTARKIKLLDTREYLIMRREALANDGIPAPSAEDYDINGTWDTSRYTDWQRELIGGSSNITNGQISISGGSENTQFIVGGSFYRESSVFPGDFKDVKASGFINLTHHSTNGKFKLDLSTRYLNDDNTIPTTDFTSGITLAPNAPAIYDSNGKFNWQNNTWNNPLAASLQKATAKSTNLNNNLILSYNILSDLQIKVNFGYNNSVMDQSILTPLSSLNPAITNNNPYYRLHTFGTSTRKTLITEPQINYSKTFGKSKINLFAAFSYQETNSKTIAQTASGFASDQLINNIGSASFIRVSDNQQNKYRYASIIGRIYYSFLDKYLLNLIARREGSSRFGPDSRFGTFSSIGAAWILSKEQFFVENIRFISFAKLRGSYGTTGNDMLPENQYLSSYSSFSIPYMGVTGLFPTRLANSNLAWEEVKKFELGVELGILAEQIVLTANYYKNKTNNQLVQYALPTSTGFNSIQANLPALLQNTGFEINLDLNLLRNNNLTWSTSANISFPKNKLVSYPNIEGSSYASLYEEGKSLFIQKKTHFLGVDSKTGQYIFEDANKDGNITTPEDIQSLTEIKQNYFGGINNRISHKGLELSFLFQFVKQTGRTYSSLFSPPGFFNANQPELVRNRWKSPGDNTKIQKYTQTFTDAGIAYFDAISMSDFVVGDASFIRLKNVYLSYEFPAKWTSKINSKSIKVYVQGQNLLTFSNYLGLDPESQGLNLPPLRSISGGLQITF